MSQRSTRWSFNYCLGFCYPHDAVTRTEDEGQSSAIPTKPRLGRIEAKQLFDGPTECKCAGNPRVCKPSSRIDRLCPAFRRVPVRGGHRLEMGETLGDFAWKTTIEFKNRGPLFKGRRVPRRGLARRQGG